MNLTQIKNAVKLYLKAESLLKKDSVINWCLENKDKVALEFNLNYAGRRGKSGSTTETLKGNKIVFKVSINPKKSFAEVLETLNHEIQLHVRPYIDAIKANKNPHDIVNSTHSDPESPLNYENQHDMLRNNKSPYLLRTHRRLFRILLLKMHSKDTAQALNIALKTDRDSHKITKGTGLEREKIQIRQHNNEDLAAEMNDVAFGRPKILFDADGKMASQKQVMKAHAAAAAAAYSPPRNAARRLTFSHKSNKSPVIAAAGAGLASSPSPPQAAGAGEAAYSASAPGVTAQPMLPSFGAAQEAVAKPPSKPSTETAGSAADTDKPPEPPKPKSP